MLFEYLLYLYFRWFKTNNPESINRELHFFNYSWLSKSKRLRILKIACPNIHDSADIAAPLHIERGTHIEIGRNSFINYGCNILNGAQITIGEGTQIGPGVSICTTYHHSNPLLRSKDKQAFSKPIVIGNHVWIGAGAIILPGVTIGSNTTIAAGSVVTRNIAANVTAAGNPCLVKKDWAADAAENES